MKQRDSVSKTLICLLINGVKIHLRIILGTARDVTCVCDALNRSSHLEQTSLRDCN